MTSDTIAADTLPPPLFSLRGRLGRARFIAYSVGCALAATLALSALGYLLLLLSVGFAPAWFELAAVVVLRLLLPLLLATLAVKRLHDIGKPGWLALLLLVPMANFAFVLLLWAWPGEGRANAYGGVPAAASALVRAAAVALPLLLLTGLLAGALLEDAPHQAALSAAPPAASSTAALRPYPP